MFAKFTTLVQAVLTGRTQYGLMPPYPHKEALQLHVDVASAIQRVMAMMPTRQCWAPCSSRSAR
jgi:hypothetical protein